MKRHTGFETGLGLETRGYQARLRELAADTDGSPESWRNVLQRAMEELRAGAFRPGAIPDWETSSADLMQCDASLDTAT